MKFVFTCIVAVALLSAPVWSQRDDQEEVEPSTPITPGGGKGWPSYVGAIVGFGFNQQSGSFISKCGCEFTKGGASGFVLGAFYEKQLSGSLSFGVLGTYENRNVTANLRVDELLLFRDEENNQEFEAPVQFKHEAEAAFHILALTPYLQWEPWNFVFLQLGLSPQIVTGGNIKHTKELAQRTIRGPGGQILLVELQGTRGQSITVQDEDFPDINSFQFAAMFMTGLNINLSDNTALVPIFQYVAPFTSLSENGQDFKISSGQLLIGFRQKL